MTTGTRVERRPAKAKARKVRASPPKGFARLTRKSAEKPPRAPKLVRESARAGARGAYRDAILGAAERVFARAGFYETRMADVAREAGVGVGTLYNYFESKEVIFSDLLTMRHRELRAVVDAASSADDPVERLRQIVGAVLAALGENGELLAVFMERGAIGECDFERLMGADHARDYEEFLGLLEKTLREATRRKKVRTDVDVRLLVTALSGAINGAIYSWLKRGRRGRLAAIADDLFAIFLEGARCP